MSKNKSVTENMNDIPPGRLVSTSVYILERVQRENMKEYEKNMKEYRNSLEKKDHIVQISPEPL